MEKIRFAKIFSLLVVLTLPLLQGCGLGANNELESVRVVPSPNLSVDSAGAVIASQCIRSPLALVGTFSNGASQDFSREPATVWSSSDPSVVSVSHGNSGSFSKGVIIPHNPGTAKITGDFQTLKASITVRVFHTRVRISPSASTLAIDTGEQLQAQEILTDPANSSSPYNRVRDISDTIQWSSSGPLKIDDKGFAVAVPRNSVSSGTATVTAAPKYCPTKSTTTGIQVTSATLTGLTISSPNSSGGSLVLPTGSKETLQVIGHFTNGSTQDLTRQLARQASAQLGNSAPQTVFTPADSQGHAAAFLNTVPRTGMRNPANVLTAMAAGTTTATATFDTANEPALGGSSGTQPTVRGHLPVTVKQANLQSITLVPQQATISVGAGQQYKVTASYDNSSIGSRVITSNPLAYYTSKDVALVTPVNDAATPGLVLGNVAGTAGQATVKGEVFDLLGNTSAETSAVLNIDASLPTQIVVTDPNGCSSGLAVRKHCQLVATATINGRTEDVTRFAVWNSSNAGAAQVDEGLSDGGNVGGLSTGTAQITAGFRGVTSSPMSVTVP